MGQTECTDLSPRYEQGLTFKVVFTQLSVCYVTMSAYFMAMLYCITLTSEEAYDALQSLNTPLEKMLVNEDDSKNVSEKINSLREKLDESLYEKKSSCSTSYFFKK